MHQITHNTSHKGTVAGPTPIWPSHSLFAFSLSNAIDQRMRVQTALLHLKPLPNASCRILCPRRRSECSSMWRSSYQIDEDDVLPLSLSTERECAMSSGERRRFFSMPSSTARPPAWMQKKWIADLNDGTYGRAPGCERPSRFAIS